jgi:hypothetical protein
MKDIGPDATPPVVFTTEFLGLRLENENPVPPPDLWIIAVSFSVWKIDSIESYIGSVKQALSCPNSLPAFIKVGEFGRNSKLVIIL